MILVLVERDDAGIHPASLEALTLASALAEPAEEVTEAVTFARLDAQDAAVLGRHGARGFRTLEHPLLDGYAPELYGESLAQLVRSTQPSALIGPATDRGTETMAQVAARLGLPLAANCTSVDAADAASGWRLVRLRQGGMVLEDAELDAPVKLATVASGAVEGEPRAHAGPATPLVQFTPDLDGVPHSRLVERTARDGGVSLATARVVVSGGRGVGSADGFAPLDELAKLAGGAVGCSRVATNNGWRPHSDQVGQTGTKISPELYIACGISGATQHWVGCMNAKNILAINTDPEAPLVTRATHAVIGDVGEVLAAVIDEVHRRRAGAP